MLMSIFTKILASTFFGNAVGMVSSFVLNRNLLLNNVLLERAPHFCQHIYAISYRIYQAKDIEIINQFYFNGHLLYQKNCLYYSGCLLYRIKLYAQNISFSKGNNRAFSLFSRHNPVYRTDRVCYLILANYQYAIILIEVLTCRKKKIQLNVRLSPETVMKLNETVDYYQENTKVDGSIKRMC